MHGVFTYIDRLLSFIPKNLTFFVRFFVPIQGLYTLYMDIWANLKCFFKSDMFNLKASNVH